MRALLAALVIVSGCEQPRATPAPAPPKVLRTQKELPTTDGAIAAGNLDAQIETARGAGLVIGLIERASVFGRVADYDRALAAAHKLPADSPARARIYAALHLFEQAEAGADDELRDTLDEARGRSDQTLARRQARAHKRATILTLGEEAAALGDLGRFDEAEQRFARAQDVYRDVSPFPVAWLYFQYGLMQQRRGLLSSAREAFEAAHQRLPRHAQATAHLAAILSVTGDQPRAIALLRELITHSDDPEYLGQLSSLLEGDEAHTLGKRAATGYDALLIKHPRAFSDHAARFWLGRDPQKALTLARNNLQWRPTADAYQLVIDCALAAKDAALACRTAELALAAPRTPPTLQLSASRAFTACGQTARANAALAAVTH